MREITPEFAAYCAGFFDGEGCVTLATGSSRESGKLLAKSPSVRVMVGQSDLEVLQEFMWYFGGRIFTQRQKANRKPFWSWRLSHQQAVPFLEAIRPYVRVKQRQVDLALLFINWKEKDVLRLAPKPQGRGWERTEIALELEGLFKTRMHELNHRGSPAETIRIDKVPASGTES